VQVRLRTERYRAASNVDQQDAATIFRDLQAMLRANNSYLQSFLTVRELIDAGQVTEDIKIVLHADRRPPGEHARCYNMPSGSEVAILLPHNLDGEVGSRVVVCDYRAGQENEGLRRFSDTHRSYDPLTYPLLFPFGSDGFHLGIQHSRPASGRSSHSSQPRCVTTREFYCYRLMTRPNSFNLVHKSCRLFQQYCVDMWAKIEAGRLNFIKHNQVRKVVFIFSCLL
jgi:hypothetical protein